MLEQSEKLARGQKIQMLSFQGKDLVDLKLNLLHNVGKASKNGPVMVNITYSGNPEKPQDVYSLVGKVFDFTMFF